MLEVSKYATRIALCALLAVLLAQPSPGQTRRVAKSRVTAKAKPSMPVGPKVIRIDLARLKPLLKPKGKPLLINFWATWCDPCREEFPDLVKLDAAYKGKIDFITISFDDLSEINTLVPKFLREMKAEMPAYLLKTPDESAAVELVSKDWAGNLPMTILYNVDGSTAFLKNSKVSYDEVTAAIDKLLTPLPTASPSPSISRQLLLFRDSSFWHRAIQNRHTKDDAIE